MLAASAAGLALTTAVASSAEAKRDDACGRQGVAIAVNEQVRVFKVEHGHQRRTFACHLATKRVTALGDEFSGTANASLIRLAISGRYVAYAIIARYQARPETYTVLRLDARSGKQQIYTAEIDSGLDGGVDGVPAVAITRTGVLAYVLESRQPRMYAVHVARDARPVAVTAPNVFAAPIADVGPDISPSSLAASRDDVYWTRGGQARVG